MIQHYGFNPISTPSEKSEEKIQKALFISSDVSELSSARLSSDLARARGLSARLSSARAIFEPARV